MKELFILDLDGTSLTSDKTILPSTKEAVKIIKKNNGEVAVATGRTQMTSLKYAKELDVSHLIETNGTKITNLKDGSIIFKDFMDRELIDLLIVFLEEFADGTILYTDQALITINLDFNSPKYKKYFELYDELLVAGKSFFKFKNNEEFKKSNLVSKLDEVAKIIAVSSPEKKGTLYDELDLVFNNKLNLSLGNASEIEINSSSNSKWNAIKILKQELNCKDVISFGDGYNDIAMLQNSKIGVAMGNAMEEIKLFADEVTDSNVEEGIYNFIKKYYKIEE